MNHRIVEKAVIISIAALIFIGVLYYFIYHIDWVDLYISKDRNEFIELNVLNESCTKCHGEVKGFSKFHNPEKIGCASCHLGNRQAKSKNEAHDGMVLIPGNLNDSKLTCGQTNCHPGISERVDSSLMTTMSGVVSVNKFAFEEIESPSGKYNIKDIGFTASESHLRNLCASCHLGNEKQEFGPVTELSRGGGCNACHLNYSENALTELNNYDSLKIVKPDSALLNFHPSLTLNITNDHCFGCHSRSGRISTSYEGWHETDLTKEIVGDDPNYRLLEDGRIFKMIEPDIHYKAGLVCIDCHISYEVMGDGNFYEHKEEQILVTCEDCHSAEKHENITLQEFDYESQKIAEIYGFNDEQRKFIKIKKTGTPLINTFIENQRRAKLIGKQSKKIHELKPPKFQCVSPTVHSTLSCNSCHTAWAPQCIGCHTDFELNRVGFDLLSNKDTDASWVEYHGEFFAELPSLGVRELNKNGKISKVVETFIPGMIMTIDKNKFDKKNTQNIFKRLYAPSVAHTIAKESRSCESCHNNSLALGYGRGTLEYIINEGIGRWVFEPKYSLVQHDNLPEDAWIGFLQYRDKYAATRENVRPFTIEEQKKILTFGACLTCHENKSKLIQSSLNEYENLLNNLSAKCILPTWE